MIFVGVDTEIKFEEHTVPATVLQLSHVITVKQANKYSKDTQYTDIHVAATTAAKDLNLFLRRVNIR